MISFDVRNRFTGEVQFTAKIDCDESAERPVKLGLAVRLAVRNGFSLREADLRGGYLSEANLSGADLRGADLSGANLIGAYLEGTIGDGRHIKSLQTDRWPVAYTADRMQIGYKNHGIEEWWAMSDGEIDEMGERALEWWWQWKSILRQIIETSPAEPTGRDAAHSSTP